MATNTAVTVLSSAPLWSNSPLKAELVPKTATKQRQKQKPSTKGMKTEVFDQPLTFHSKVKSSGYSSSAARSKMFSPSTCASKPKKASAFPLKKAASTSLCSGASLKEYPMDSEAPTDLQHKLSLTEKPAPINCIVFSDNGKHIACGLANKSVHMMRPPPSSKETVFTDMSTGMDWEENDQNLSEGKVESTRQVLDANPIFSRIRETSRVTNAFGQQRNSRMPKSKAGGKSFKANNTSYLSERGPDTQVIPLANASIVWPLITLKTVTGTGTCPLVIEDILFRVKGFEPS